MNPVYLPLAGTQITVDNQGIKLTDAINAAILAAGNPAFLTGGTGAQSTAATWAAITDGSFRISIDGTAYNVTAIDFTGDATMADVAATIQAKLRTATGGLETVVWSTDHFVISSVDEDITSEISVLTTSTAAVGTDISGAGASDWMDANTGAGNGVVTERVAYTQIDWNNDDRFDGIDSLFLQVESGENVRLLWDGNMPTSAIGVKIFVTGSKDFAPIPVKSVKLCSESATPAVCNLQIGFTKRG